MKRDKCMDMDLITFVEKVLGINRTFYQKGMLKLYSSLSKDSCIVMGRNGPMILDSNGKMVDYVKESYERNIINCEK